ncbi:MAG: hemerythrin domain-containing protein [Myxococcota bacterium]
MSEMKQGYEDMDRSDLLEWANHEHEHLDRLFKDLRATFGRIAAGEVPAAQMREVVDQAVEDLDAALGDMLEHFADEEEVYFLAIQELHPSYSTQIESLIDTHESLTRRTRGLRGKLSAGPKAIQEDAMSLIADLNGLFEELSRHNAEEQVLFDEALKQLTADERAELLTHRQSLG